MNWKEFFKPEWRKIAILVIILFFCLFLYQFLTLAGGLPPTVEELALRELISNILITINWPLFIVQNAVYFNIPNAVYLILIILDFIWLYVISSLLVWIYDKKFKKRKKRK